MLHRRRSQAPQHPRRQHHSQRYRVGAPSPTAPAPQAPWVPGPGRRLAMGCGILGPSTLDSVSWGPPWHRWAARVGAVALSCGRQGATSRQVGSLRHPVTSYGKSSSHALPLRWQATTTTSQEVTTATTAGLLRHPTSGLQLPGDAASATLAASAQGFRQAVLLSPRDHGGQSPGRPNALDGVA